MVDLISAITCANPAVRSPRQQGSLQQHGDECSSAENRAHRTPEGAGQSINQDSSSTWVASETGNTARYTEHLEPIVLRFAADDAVALAAD